MNAFFESVAWPMVLFRAYGAFHILYTLLGFAVCALVAWKLRKANDKTINCILFGIGMVLALSEVFKQFFCYYVIENDTYHWAEFPFQLCSVPLYLCLIAPLLKPGKVQRALYSFMVLYNLLGGAIAFAEPSGLFHEYWFLTMHSCIWHMLLVFVGLLLCFSKRGGCTTKDYKAATWTFLALCGVAFMVNCIVQLGLGEHINMFFVGPGDSPIIVFKFFSQKLGWYVNTPIYMAAVCLGAYLIFLLIYSVQNKALPGRKKQAVG